jgi:hypothetical protein
MASRIESGADASDRAMFEAGEPGILPNEESDCVLAPRFGDFLAMVLGSRYTT